jgi:hypothetical protein
MLCFCVVARLLIVLASILVAMPLMPVERFSERNLVFLTRDGCVNTARMRSSLDQALKSLALPTNYEVIDADKLERSDRRRGYGTRLRYFTRVVICLAWQNHPCSPARHLDAGIRAEFRP